MAVNNVGENVEAERQGGLGLVLNVSLAGFEHYLLTCPKPTFDLFGFNMLVDFGHDPKM